ncbi:hypothetical protein DFH08DRAFT_1049511 [Mycena albidolilacea]|uniref:Uncharacterized protein n=1 Tax=Mycena albidolilacea TaxID=1033008 RepID=A0AAD6Z7H5_9AGAR|nr:hypothetical protein DFH08DRAFT_1049511 [Mycena albidolilacea]
MHQLYPDEIIVGTPFDTSILNSATSQFNCPAAFQPSRSSAQNRFLSKRRKGIPFLGSFLAPDLLNAYFGGELTECLINFTAKLDPTLTERRSLYDTVSHLISGL